MTNQHIDNMTIDELVSKIQKLAYSVKNHVDDMRGPEDAIYYTQELSIYTTNLLERLEAYAEDVA